MNLSTPTCPTCGQPAASTLETVYGRALLIRNPDGSFDYEGETKIDWDTQETVTEADGSATLHCESRHAWQSSIT